MNLILKFFTSQEMILFLAYIIPTLLVLGLSLIIDRKKPTTPKNQK